MFDKQYRFRGRHAVRVDKLTGVFDTYWLQAVITERT